MTISIQHDPRSINLVPFMYEQRPRIVFTEPSQDEHESSPHSSPISDTEQLLDIESLLEVEKIVHIIKKDGRLNNAGKESREQFKTKQVKLPKNNQ